MAEDSQLIPQMSVCVLGLTADRMDSAVIIFLHLQEVLTWPSLCGEHLLPARPSQAECYRLKG